KAMADSLKGAAEANRPIEEERDRCLAQVGKVSGDRALRLIPTAARRAPDEEKDRYIDLARRAHLTTREPGSHAAALRLYEELLAHLRTIAADLGRYITLVGQIRTQLQADENRAVTRPTDVTGEVLFDPGRRVVDAAGNESYVGGDIEARYQAYA